MPVRFTAAFVSGGIALLLSVSRHAMPIAASLQLTRGASIQEMALFARFSGLVSFVFLFVLPFVVGYVLGTRVDFGREYPSLAGAIGLGGGLGYLVGTAIIVPTTSVTPGFITTVLLLIGAAIAVGTEVAIVSFAGGALAWLRLRASEAATTST